jgi:hypothetical protein
MLDVRYPRRREVQPETPPHLVLRAQPYAGHTEGLKGDARTAKQHRGCHCVL